MRRFALQEGCEGLTAAVTSDPQLAAVPTFADDDVADVDPRPVRGGAACVPANNTTDAILCQSDDNPMTTV